MNSGYGDGTTSTADLRPLGGRVDSGVAGTLRAPPNASAGALSPAGDAPPPVAPRTDGEKPRARPILVDDATPFGVEIRLCAALAGLLLPSEASVCVPPSTGVPPTGVPFPAVIDPTALNNGQSPPAAPLEAPLLISVVPPSRLLYVRAACGP